MTKLQEINFSGSLNFGQSLQQTIRMFSQQKKTFLFLQTLSQSNPQLDLSVVHHVCFARWLELRSESYNHFVPIGFTNMLFFLLAANGLFFTFCHLLGTLIVPSTLHLDTLESVTAQSMKAFREAFMTVQ